MVGWKEKTLGEVTSFITKGIPPKYSDYESGSTLWVLNQKCNRNFEISYLDARLHDYKLKKVPENKLLVNGDVLINSTGIGTAGRVAQIQNIQKPTTIDGHMILLRPTDEIDVMYYGYAIKACQGQIEGIAEGSTGQTEINRKRLQDEVIVRYPVDKQKQKAIAYFLFDIDKKIKINTEINNNLEQQAVLLFKEWFTDFVNTSSNLIETRFGLIPDTFRLLKNGELRIVVTDYVANGSFASLKANVTLYQESNYAYFIRNTDLKSGSFEVFVDEHSYRFLSKSTLYGGEIIISNVGDVGSVFLCPKLKKPMTLGNNIIMLRSEQDNLKYYLYIWFKWLYGKSLIQGIKGGSAQPKFNKTDFKSLPIFLPPDDLLERFHQTVKPMFELIEKNNEENQGLRVIRDTLLPKLMSGELDVSNIDF